MQLRAPPHRLINVRKPIHKPRRKPGQLDAEYSCERAMLTKRHNEPLVRVVKTHQWAPCYALRDIAPRMSPLCYGKNRTHGICLPVLRIRGPRLIADNKHIRITRNLKKLIYLDASCPRLSLNLLHRAGRQRARFHPSRPDNCLRRNKTVVGFDTIIRHLRHTRVIENIYAQLCMENFFPSFCKPWVNAVLQEHSAAFNDKNGRDVFQVRECFRELPGNEIREFSRKLNASRAAADYDKAENISLARRVIFTFRILKTLNDTVPDIRRVTQAFEVRRMLPRAENIVVVCLRARGKHEHVVRHFNKITRGRQVVVVGCGKTVLLRKNNLSVSVNKRRTSFNEPPDTTLRERPYRLDDALGRKPAGRNFVDHRNEHKAVMLANQCNFKGPRAVETPVQLHIRGDAAEAGADNAHADRSRNMHSRIILSRVRAVWWQKTRQKQTFCNPVEYEDNDDRSN